LVTRRGDKVRKICCLCRIEGSKSALNRLEKFIAKRGGGSLLAIGLGYVEATHFVGEELLTCYSDLLHDLFCLTDAPEEPLKLMDSVHDPFV
jgi:hypothetical protein